MIAGRQWWQKERQWLPAHEPTDLAVGCSCNIKASKDVPKAASKEHEKETMAYAGCSAVDIEAVSTLLLSFQLLAVLANHQRGWLVPTATSERLGKRIPWRLINWGGDVFDHGEWWGGWRRKGDSGWRSSGRGRGCSGVVLV